MVTSDKSMNGYLIRWYLFLAIAFLLWLIPEKPMQASVATDSSGVSIISELLADRDGDGHLDRLGERVRVRGRATVGSGVFGTPYMTLYIQDSSAGIMIFSKKINTSVARGDSLHVTGTLEMHSSKPEVVVEHLEIINADGQVPEAVSLDRAFRNPERHRGLLVSGEAIVQKNNFEQDVKMLQIAPYPGSEDSLHVFVSRSNVDYENFLFDGLKEGERVHVSGILIRYMSGTTGSILYEILPRRRDDFTIGNPRPMLQKDSFIYADIDTDSERIFVLVESGLWGYDLRSKKWQFLDALDEFKEDFEAYEFGFDQQSKNIQFWSRGIGEIYTIDPETYNIKRKDHSFDYKNQLGHFPFYRDSTLYAFGGYGHWEPRNIMVYYNHPQNEWNIQNVVPNTPLPSRRVPITGVYHSESDQVYIYGGRSSYEDQSIAQRTWRDIWSFSFADQQWEKVMTLDQSDNEQTTLPRGINKTNKNSTSFYLPDQEIWFIPGYRPTSLNERYHFKPIHLPSGTEKSVVSPDLSSFKDFRPTNFLYNPNGEEVVMIGVDYHTNADSYPVRVSHMSNDTLLVGVRDKTFFAPVEPFLYLVGLTVIGGVLFWFYRNREKEEEAIGQAKPLTFHQLMQFDRLNQQEVRLLAYLYKQDRFMDSNEIEELLWSDIDSYDYRRRLRNDTIKSINRKFKDHRGVKNTVILRRKDPNDNRRYLYGLNSGLFESL